VSNGLDEVFRPRRTVRRPVCGDGSLGVEHPGHAECCYACRERGFPHDAVGSVRTYLAHVFPVGLSFVGHHDYLRELCRHFWPGPWTRSRVTASRRLVGGDHGAGRNVAAELAVAADIRSADTLCDSLFALAAVADLFARSVCRRSSAAGADG